MATAATLLFLGTPQDIPYLPRLKALVGGASVYVLTAPITTWAEVSVYCKKRNITGVFSTSRTLLQKLTWEEKVSVDDYAGSYFRRDDIEVVFVDPRFNVLAAAPVPKLIVVADASAEIEIAPVADVTPIVPVVVKFNAPDPD